MGVKGLDRAKAILEAHVGHVYPGAVLRVDGPEGCLFEAAVGRPGRPDAIYDLASLTKPLATTTCLMTLVAEGRVLVQDPLGKHLLEAIGTDKESLTIASLLDHSSGLPWWQDLARPILRRLGPKAAGSMEAKREVLRMVLSTALTHPPGTKAVYSDLGFILLGFVVERLSRLPLDEAFSKKVAIPLGLAGTFFIRIAEGIPKPGPGLVPTTRRARGRVHDTNAYCLGGVAGHAGLFGSAAEVARVLRALHRAYLGHRDGPFDPDVVSLFLTPSRVPGSTRTFGFDTPSQEGSLAGDRHPPRLVGHTGFTGTMFWLDLDSGVSIVLLTNRVRLGAPIPALNEVRRAVCEAVFDALGPWG